MKKKLVVAPLMFILMLSLMFTTVSAKAKPKLNKTKITITVGKSYKLKLKNNKKKVKWSSKNKKIATVSKKGKVVGKKKGTTYIYAKVGKKKYKCKVKVNAKPKTTPQKPAVGTRQNPANPRNGVTVKTDHGTMYFKLTSTMTGTDAINKLRNMGEWDEYDDQEILEYPNTTVTYFEWDVKAVSGYAQYPLSGLDIVNEYGLYNEACTKNINGIEASYMENAYESQDKTSLELYGGASSKMYMVLYVPNGMHSFSYPIITDTLDYYWTKYTF